jgi:hypothetical protein
METLTRALTSLLVPEDVLKVLSQSSSHVAFSVDPKLDFIPWNGCTMAAISGCAGIFGVEVHEKTPLLQPFSARPIPMLVVVSDPDRDLPHAIAEARSLVREMDRGRFFAAHLVVNPRVDELIRLFNLQAVVHYIGHTVIADFAPGPGNGMETGGWHFRSGGNFRGGVWRCPRAPCFFQCMSWSRSRLRIGIGVSAGFFAAGRRAICHCIHCGCSGSYGSRNVAGFLSGFGCRAPHGGCACASTGAARARLGGRDITWMVHALYGNRGSAFSRTRGRRGLCPARLPGRVPYKPPRPGGFWRVWSRRMELLLLVMLAGATAFQCSGLFGLAANLFLR